MVVVTIPTKRTTSRNISKRCNAALTQALRHLNKGAEVSLGIPYTLQRRFPQETATLKVKWTQA